MCTLKLDYRVGDFIKFRYESTTPNGYLVRYLYSGFIDRIESNRMILNGCEVFYFEHIIEIVPKDYIS